MDEAEIIIGPLVEHLSEEDRVSYKVDHRPDERERRKPAPDFLVVDSSGGNRKYVEMTAAVQGDYRKYEAGAYELRWELEKEVRGSLPGTFVLSLPMENVWRDGRHRQQVLDNLVSEISSRAKNLRLDEEAKVGPSRCKLMKVKDEGSTLYCCIFYGQWAPVGEEVTQILVPLIDEANRKFSDIGECEGALVVNVFESGGLYGRLVSRSLCSSGVLASRIGTYPKVNRLYLADQSPIDEGGSWRFDRIW